VFEVTVTITFCPGEKLAGKLGDFVYGATPPEISRSTTTLVTTPLLHV
jgi:hypothetical protein